MKQPVITTKTDDSLYRLQDLTLVQRDVAQKFHLTNNAAFSCPTIHWGEVDCFEMVIGEGEGEWG